MPCFGYVCVFSRFVLDDESAQPRIPSSAAVAAEEKLTAGRARLEMAVSQPVHGIVELVRNGTRRVFDPRVCRVSRRVAKTSRRSFVHRTPV